MGHGRAAHSARVELTGPRGEVEPALAALALLTDQHYMSVVAASRDAARPIGRFLPIKLARLARAFFFLILFAESNATRSCEVDHETEFDGHTDLAGRWHGGDLRRSTVCNQKGDLQPRPVSDRVVKVQSPSAVQRPRRLFPRFELRSRKRVG
jgi:hypothetical protein